MKRLKNTNRYLDLSVYGINEKFDVYKLGNYDFSENLKFDDKIGVYMFTIKSGDFYCPNPNSGHYFYHTPVYCGKTSDTDTRFYDHHKGDESKEVGANRFAFHPCNSNEEAEALEKRILSLIDFPENEVNNSNAQYKEAKMKEEVKA